MTARTRRTAATTNTQPTTTKRTCGKCLACNVLGCAACPCHQQPTGRQGALVRLETRAERGKLEEPFWAQLAAILPREGLPLPVRQAKWHPTRQFRADFLWRFPLGLIVEIDGGTWATDEKAKGHGMGPGYDRNCRRDAEAVICGYRTLRFSAPMVRDGEALGYTIAALKALLGTTGTTGTTQASRRIA